MLNKSRGIYDAIFPRFFAFGYGIHLQNLRKRYEKSQMYYSQTFRKIIHFQDKWSKYLSNISIPPPHSMLRSLYFKILDKCAPSQTCYVYFSVQCSIDARSKSKGMNANYDENLSNSLFSPSLRVFVSSSFCLFHTHFSFYANKRFRKAVIKARAKCGLCCRYIVFAFANHPAFHSTVIFIESVSVLVVNFSLFR